MARWNPTARAHRPGPLLGRVDSRRASRSRQGRLSALVVDASVVAGILRRAPAVEALSWRMQEEARPLHAPALCDLEIASFIRRLLRARAASEPEAADLLGRYLTMPIQRHDHTPLLVRVLELRDRLTAYDAAYVALAERLEAALATVDGAVATVARDLGIEVLG